MVGWSFVESCREMPSFSEKMYFDYEKSYCYYVIRGYNSHCIVCEELGIPCAYAKHVQRKYEEVYGGVLSEQDLQKLVTTIIRKGDAAVLNAHHIIHIR